MVSNLTVLFARRGYEFAPGSLRLTSLSAQPVVQQIQVAFGFQVAVVATPPPTFGPVQVSAPPGLVFQSGAAILEGTIVPVRSLFIEPSRVVIEVGAGSQWIDPVFSMLRSVVDTFSFATRESPLGEPASAGDFSAVTAEFTVPLDRLLVPKARALLRDAFGGAQSTGTVLAPLVLAHQVAAGEPYVGPAIPGVELALRVGALPSHKVYLSAAFLGTEDHALHVARLGEAIGSK